jgi:hypothetical protein
MFNLSIFLIESVFLLPVSEGWKIKHFDKPAMVLSDRNNNLKKDIFNAADALLVYQAGNGSPFQ